MPGSHSPPDQFCRFGALLVTLFALWLSGCATAGVGAEPEKKKNPDPFEGFNRGVYKFNDALDRHALKPVAKAYREHVPEPIQTGVGNFFTNLSYPATVVNQFLQGKFKEGGQDTLRLLINTTLGWGGIFDVASGARLPIHDEDSGQTLGRWGVPPGPYLMVPFLGPASVRDAPARIADDFYTPFRWYNADNERWFALGLQFIDQRSRLLPLDRMLSETYDPYAFIRDAYLQRRVNAVYDGNPPAGAVKDEDDADWAEKALQEDAEAAGESVDQDGAASGDATKSPSTTTPPSPEAGEDGADPQPPQ
jgi:phospholipid-binding lipoprotein MlaA